MTKDPPPSHERTALVYEKMSKDKEKKIVSRRDQTLLAKIRSGHTILFSDYKARLDPAHPNVCPLCGESPHDLEHWLTKCAGTENKRRELFGYEDMSKWDSLTKYPTEAVALARSTLPGASE